MRLHARKMESVPALPGACPTGRERAWLPPLRFRRPGSLAALSKGGFFKLDISFVRYWSRTGAGESYWVSAVVAFS